MKGYPSAASCTVNVNFNRLPQLRAALPGLVQKRIQVAAEMFREQLTDSLKSGRQGLQSDTAALVQSLHIKTPHGSDYDERLAAAAAAYLGNPSQWRDLVKLHVTSAAYTNEHFAARVAREEPLRQPSRDEAVAAVATMLVWGFFWEYGHYNQLTGNYEHRPWMGPESDAFTAEKFQLAFFGLMEGFA